MLQESLLFLERSQQLGKNPDEWKSKCHMDLKNV